MSPVGKRVLIGVGIVVVVAALVAATAAWWRWDTQRQPRVEDVAADMNTAVADAVVAAGSEAAAAVSAVVAAAECDLGPLRTGNVFTGKADLYTDPGAEDSLITTIEQNLPDRYAVRRGPAVAGVRPLHADLGAVSLSVRRLSPGWLAVTARSRCSLAEMTPAASTAPDAGTVTGLLATLGTRPARVTEQRLHCAAGDIVTVSAVSEPTGADGLRDRLTAAVPAGARRFAARDSNRITYRDGSASVVIAASDDGAAITVQHTTTC
ncbi:hypothetical protein Ait01nite_056980 [Actinoplanes italicus]|uniref:Uncharacterized protein n=1 Tax=Actinoplanes italicus TaxID=113567 RepID=A0A2T0K5M5_9ACTN|nr:hypothetical protein [Actinoplanes italicus]PRX18250.1 hypothetical protein CLV67_11383 [Actinoplanes italicus]GIE32653.1 hypothetical protein Ait01nite_056980 [Actinoplanes italicus]